MRAIAGTLGVSLIFISAYAAASGSGPQPESVANAVVTNGILFEDQIGNDPSQAELSINTNNLELVNTGPAMGIGDELSYLVPLAKNGDKDAQYQLGILYSTSEWGPEDKQQSIFWFQKAADNGHVKAQLNLARLYADGDGIPEHNLLAVYWYKLAAQNNDGEAQYELAQMFSEGRMVGVSKSEAISYFLKAAQQGHQEAQFDLAKMHLNGSGTPKNIMEGYAWMNIVVAQGHNKAEETIKRIRISRKMLAEAQDLSLSLWDQYVTPFK